MRTFSSSLLGGLIMACALAADKPAGAAQNPSQEGVWKPIAAVLGGVRIPKEALDAVTLKVAGASYEVIAAGEAQSDKGTRKIDASATPKRITLISTNGPNAGKTFLGIYEMKDENSLRVCYDLSGKEFPTEFRAPKGTQLYLVGYRRVKATAPALTPENRE